MKQDAMINITGELMSPNKRKAYMKTPYQTHNRVYAKITPESLTQQNMQDECDVNSILEKYRRSGILPQTINCTPTYGDYSDIQTYQESLNTVLKAQTLFDALPSTVRERFANDPARLISFVNDPQNADEMVKLGLASKRRLNDENLASPTSPSETKQDL